MTLHIAAIPHRVREIYVCRYCREWHPLAAFSFLEAPLAFSVLVVNHKCEGMSNRWISVRKSRCRLEPDPSRMMHTEAEHEHLWDVLQRDFPSFWSGQRLPSPDPRTFRVVEGHKTPSVDVGALWRPEASIFQILLTYWQFLLTSANFSPAPLYPSLPIVLRCR